MKKILLIIIMVLALSPSNILATTSEKTTTVKLTRIESLSKKEKLNIIYLCGGVILVASSILIIPLVKEKRK